MKIAIITSGILPIPAVQGGAVENLIDYYLEYNNLHRLHNITVYSVWHPEVKKHEALKSEVNHYEYINTHSFWFRLYSKVYSKLHPNSYYFHHLEYFFELAYRKLRKQHFDLIILENRPGFALKLKERLDTPIISHIHTDIINTLTSRVDEIIKAHTGFICVSKYIQKRISDVGIPTRTTVVYNGLDTEQFKPSLNNINRQAFGFNEKDFIVIYTGRIVPDKGVKELIEAIALLKEEKDIKLLVVGGSNFADSVNHNTFLDELQEMERQLNGKVHFTGFVPYSELPNYLSLANVAVVPSRINEALGMSAIEATAMGLPIIATNDGGLPEALIGQKNIIIDKNKNLTTQIAEAILEIKGHYADYTGNQLNAQFTKEVYTQSFYNSLCSLYD